MSALTDFDTVGAGRGGGRGRRRSARSLARASTQIGAHISRAAILRAGRARVIHRPRPRPGSRRRRRPGPGEMACPRRPVGMLFGGAARAGVGQH